MDSSKKNPPFPLGQKGQQNETCVDMQQARFFIIHRKEGSFDTVSPFLVDKCLTNCVGIVKSVKKIRSGDLLVEVANSNQGSKLLQCNVFGEIPVVVSVHGSLNFSRGVISEGELFHVSEEEILAGLKEQHVCGVRRITIRRDGKILPTKHLILTFDSPSLPQSIKAGYLRCPVRPFIPNPLRCFQCQRFGHSKASCRGTAICPLCAEASHDGAECKATLKCANCKGEHTAFARTCPKWILEKEIQVVKVKENISFLDARKRVLMRTPRAGVSYAAAVKEVRTIATQTDSLKPKTATVKKASKSSTSRPTSPKVVQIPLSVQSVFVQKPLNQPLPSNQLNSKTQRSKSARRSRKTSKSPTKHRQPKYQRNTAQNINKKLKDGRFRESDTVDFPNQSDTDMEMSEFPAETSGIGAPLPPSPS